MRGASGGGVSRWGWILAIVLAGFPVLAAAQGREVHGENSTFAGEGLALAWGILKAANDDQSQVVIRIVPLSGAYAYASVEGVDPFTQKRVEILVGQSLIGALEVRSLRATFADFPRREIRLFTAGNWQAWQPALTIYYLGVPDTTPEFLTESALSAYLDATLSKLREKGQ